jgi:hypothetical protein
MAMNRSKHEAGVALTHGVTCSAGRPELDANTVGRGRRVQQASERRSPWPGENGEVLGGNSACRFGSGPEFRGVARLCKQPAKGLFAKLEQHVRETQLAEKGPHEGPFLLCAVGLLRDPAWAGTDPCTA